MTHRHTALTVTQKIPREATGLKDALYVHVDHDGNGKVLGVRFSHRAKEAASTMDAVLRALGDAVTEIVETIQKGERTE